MKPSIVLRAPGRFDVATVTELAAACGVSGQSGNAATWRALQHLVKSGEVVREGDRRQVSRYRLVPREKQQQERRQ